MGLLDDLTDQQKVKLTNSLTRCEWELVNIL